MDAALDSAGRLTYLLSPFRTISADLTKMTASVDGGTLGVS
jgi:hypothetical protein